MKAHSENIRKILHAIPTLAWSAKADGSAEFFNQRWLEYTGLTQEEALGWNWKIIIHPDDLRNLLEKWKELISSGHSGETEARVRRFDGEFRWCQFGFDALRDEQGNTVQWYGTITDIQAGKRAAAELHWSEVLLAGEKRVLEMLAKGENQLRIRRNWIRSFRGVLQKKLLTSRAKVVASFASVKIPSCNNRLQLGVRR